LDIAANKVSINVWINKRGNGSGTNLRAPIVSKGDTQYNLGIFGDSPNAGKAEWCIFGSTWNCVFSNSPLLDNVWYNLQADFDGTNVRLY
jgi:hypothetical protein